MATRRRVNSNINYKKLTSQDVLCPLCRSILIKPITLPCKHGFCASCFDVTMGNANLVCPLCRVRIGSWLRSAKKSKNLIDEDFWKAIQDLFPLQVRSKLSRMDENFRKSNYTIEEVNDDMLQRRTVQTKPHQNFLMKLKTQELQLRHETNQFETDSLLVKKITQQLIGCSEGSGSEATDAAVKNNQAKNSLLNNFANKEYTCRILCQNIGAKNAQNSSNVESLVHDVEDKSMQRVAEIDNVSERSNSIEAEYLYFKPIDYRRNPPAKGFPAIKVPPQRPRINTNMQILPPGGPNGLHLHSLESAFARLFSLSTLVKEGGKDDDDSSVEIIEVEESNPKAVTPRKRKHVKSISKSKKRLKTAKKTPVSQRNRDPVDSPSNSPTFLGFESAPNSPNGDNLGKNADSVKSLMRQKRLQEEADFELARKLQEAFNQSSMYSTRSRVPKLAATKR